MDSSDGWFEEDAPIYGHFKDPYKRVEILPSTRRVTIQVGDVVIADSTHNMFLFETMLRPRYYMPKTAVSLTPPASSISSKKDYFLISSFPVPPNLISMP